MSCHSCKPTTFDEPDDRPAVAAIEPLAPSARLEPEALPSAAYRDAPTPVTDVDPSDRPNTFGEPLAAAAPAADPIKPATALTATDPEAEPIKPTTASADATPTETPSTA